MDRDDLLVEDYESGRPVPEISRIHGVSVRRIYQILNQRGISRGRNTRYVEKPLSRCHESIGRRIYDHYFITLDLTRKDAAKQLGWTIAKLKAVEKGYRNLDLFDLQDIAAWMKIHEGDLFDGS